MNTRILALFGLLVCGTAATNAPAQTSSPGAIATVLDHYLNVQTALAHDTLKNVPTSAQAIAASARRDKQGTIPTEIVRRADALAKATTLAQAREVFRPLSDALIEQLGAGGFPPGTYYKMYCPIAKAVWLQTDREAENPYLGLRAKTPTWGWGCTAVVKAKFEHPSGGDRRKGAQTRKD